MAMLKLSHVYSFDTMVNILQAMPNLTNLKVDTFFTDCDGYRWAEMRDNYLPKLKIFRLQIHMKLLDKSHNARYVYELVDSFRNRFWLEKTSMLTSITVLKTDNDAEDHLQSLLDRAPN
ncbi:unnamed protein product [Rotaria sp. Silwood1]|nr:unnamed protein product [Rotaria sp. Silwood1]CAF1228209.1 unnamed protein product [Rotaria sp. Silwood1]CAF1230838.1 unnamed protein product [Rotaria sp. Silwood1]CAF3485720.1 unnamed protein product [Rotaria sp. Silwood1]CAF3490382.1 unnamed protein product [Rotaria sp. Silwood1]